MNAFLDIVTAIDSRWILLVLLISLDTWAISLVLASRTVLREKALWSGVILLCPIVGCLLWYVLGPKPSLVGERKKEE